MSGFPPPDASSSPATPPARAGTEGTSSTPPYRADMRAEAEAAGVGMKKDAEAAATAKTKMMKKACTSLSEGR